MILFFCRKVKRYDKDGTLILHKGDYITDEELPKIGENYIFVGIGQPNGTILLQDLYSDTPYTEENKEKYLDYINNQENVDRERFKSIYSVLDHILSYAEIKYHFSKPIIKVVQKRQKDIPKLILQK